MKKCIFILLTTFSIIYSQNVNELGTYPISTVDIRNVTLIDSFWLPKIKLIQNRTIDYALEKCNEEGRMQNFLVAGKEKEGIYCGKMPFDDTDLYKIIEGASLSLVSNPNEELDYYLDSLISIIKIGQEPDGYLTTWSTIDRKNPPATWVKPDSNRWTDLGASHELYNSGHLFEAAAAHFWATGKKNFLDIAIKNADLLTKTFGRDKLSIPPGHQIVETGLIKLFQITENESYLNLAKEFLDLRGDSTTHKLYGEYSQDHLPVIEQTEAVGHAVRALYMYAGMTDIAVYYEDDNYLKAVRKIWDNIVNKKMYITGGLGSKHEGEAFGENYELPNLTAYNETCAAIGSVYWNHRLFLMSGDSKYYDIIERTLYNGLISGISLDGEKFFYPNPLESDGEYKFNMGSTTRKPWFDCSCCPTNMIRFLPSLPGLVYSFHEDTVYLNLFISSKAELKMKDDIIQISQNSNYPWKGNTIFTINLNQPKEFTLKIRIPGWLENKPTPGDLYKYADTKNTNLVVRINETVLTLKPSNGYLEITRVWKNEDEISLHFEMPIHKVIANENVEDDKDKIAYARGPVVYCAEKIDNPKISEINITKNLSFETKKKEIMSEKVISLHAKTEDSEISLIPYYVWSNRGAGKMNVWFPIN